MLIVPPTVYVKETGTPRGRGVFAGRAFTQGELVEACPVVPFDLKPGSALPPEIKRLMFSWGFLSGGQRGQQALALGYGSMYNHSNPASLRYEAEALTRILRFIAVRDIGVDEELTINYNVHGGGAEWTDDAWFKRMGVKPIIGS